MPMLCDQEQMLMLGDLSESEKIHAKRFFHFTDVDSAHKISESGSIRASTKNSSNDAIRGEGVYVTDKDPSTHSRREIIENNYLREKPENARKADWAFQVETSGHEVEKVRDGVYKVGGGEDVKVKPYELSDRSVWLYRSCSLRQERLPQYSSAAPR